MMSVVLLAIVALAIATAVKSYRIPPRQKYPHPRLLMSTTTAAMDYTKLGGSDLTVSKVCLGSMTWGQQNTEDEGVEQLNYAFNDCGINFLDTAEIYPVPVKPETQGRTDRTIARWLKGMDRKKVTSI